MFTDDLHEVLGQMLHYHPKKRMTLEQLFENRFLSLDVAKHFEKNKPKHEAKIHFGQSSVRTDKLSAYNGKMLAEVQK